jgi:hypothetical protein
MVDKVTRRQIAEFEATLINELNRSGVFTKRNFLVPGSGAAVDVYIASPVRAFIVIKFRSSPTASLGSRLIHQFKHLNQKFNGELVPILITNTSGWDSAPLTAELRK